MNSQPVCIVDAGMVTGVGLCAPSTCAAVRCAIDNFRETGFIGFNNERIVGSEVPLPGHWRGVKRLAKLAAAAILQCDSIACIWEDVPLLLCLSEKSRPGRPANLADSLFPLIESELGRRIHPCSEAFDYGHAGIAAAIARARELIARQLADHVIIAGVDSLLQTECLTQLKQNGRLISSVNSDGFIPGEAAAAIVLARDSRLALPRLECTGLGFAQETATATATNDVPLRADGLTHAIKGALGESGCSMSDIDFRMTDVSGEYFGFKESSLALLRTLRTNKDHFPTWQPSESLGEVGAAIGPICLGMMLTAATKGYTPGRRALCHFSNEDGQRAAIILTWISSQSPGRI